MFWEMIKEEWRIHSTLFGNLIFALFPLLILALSFGLSLLYPLISNAISANNFWLIVHYFFLIFGVIVGGFGLLGKEFMNRRFGQESLIAYSSRSLPVSEWNIFLNFFFKDLLYYFILWILPIFLGLFLASPIISISFNALLLLFSVFLSFMLGLSASFILSSIYSYSSKFLIFILIIISIPLFFAKLNLNFLYLLPSYSLFINFSCTNLLFSILIISWFSFISLFFLRIDYNSGSRMFNNWFNNFNKFLKNSFVSKDLLDLHRSEGGLGKIIFSFIFPLALVWVLLFFFFSILPTGNFFLVFSILLGIICSSMYNWLTEFEVFSSYEFLPVKTSKIIISKFISYSFLNLVAVFILIIACIQSNSLNYFFHGLFALIVSSYYTLATTVFLTGLYPNILIYNPKIMLSYLVISMIVPVLLISVSLINPDLLLLSPLIMLINYFLLKASLAKWDSWNKFQL
ncbi:MAG: hypothetical protein PHN56_02405 [Candidatus Nanoarchaeia archaeon]|nr:hypothetical protein [Candidatus Nanoarchaeia archaeon]